MSKIKDFFKNYVLNNIGYKILAIVIAILIWVIIINIQDPEMTKTINGITVEMLNTDKIPDNEYVYTITSGETANITITGKKSVISKLSAEDFYASADFSELSITNAVPVNVTLNNENSQYASQVGITQKTHSVVLSMETIGEIDIPVEIETVGEVPEGILIEKMECEKNSLSVHAPKSEMEKLSKFIVTVNLSDVGDDTSIRCTPVLYNKGGEVVTNNTNGISYDDSELNINFTTMSYYKEINISVEGYTGTPAEGCSVNNVVTSFSKVKVKGAKDDIDQINELVISKDRINVDGASENVVVNIALSDVLPAGVEVEDSNKTLIVTVNITKQETTATVETETTVSA